MFPSDVQVVGLNPRLRFLKYEPGDVFHRHRDGSYATPDGSSVSRYTFQLFLNGAESYEGGRTVLWLGTGPDRECSIHPEAGKCVVFDHRILHEGGRLEAGVNCGKVVGDKWEKYLSYLQDDCSEGEALNKLGLKRYCCRRMVLTHVDLIEKLLQ
ncbi:DNA-directed RNA polymerase II subunit L [Thoreauomyces humboldtii]|nr:DNA-directed RNA polymerase II subunit L [Thoreauomyces humboldtii]